MSDYQDWLRVDQWTNVPLFQGVKSNVGVACVTLGPFYIAPWESLSFQVDNGNSGKAFSVGILWQDTVGGPFVSNDTYVCSTQVPQIIDTVVCQGQYVTFQLASNVGTIASMNVNIVPRRGYHRGADVGVIQALIDSANNAVGIGGTLTLNPSYVTASEAVLTVYSSQFKFAATLQTKDINNAQVGVCGAIQTDGGATPLSIPVTLPFYPVQLVVQNLSGVACTMHAGLHLSR